MQMAEAVKQKALCVCGYHVYKDIWKLTVGETVVCVLEPVNFHGKNAVAVEESLAICHGRYHTSMLFS